MPKIKTKRSAAKRFSTTGSGRFRRRQKNMRHIMTKMSAKRKRRLGNTLLVDKADEKGVSRMLPNG